MEDLVSLNENLRRLRASENELTFRISRLEEYMQGYLPISQFSEFNHGITSSSTDISVLSKKVEKIIARLALEEDHFISVQGSFSQSYFRHMMMSLSLPGMKFFGEQHHPGFHTCLWVFIHVLALLFSFVYIKEEYDNWQRSPVVRTLSNNLTFNHELPFPAISVCLPFSLNDSYDYAGSMEKCFSCNTSDEDDDCFYNDICTFKEKASLALASVICHHNHQRNVSSAPWFVFQENIQKSIKSEDFSIYAENVFPPCDVNVTHEREKNYKTSLKSYYSESGCYNNEFQHFVSNLGMCFTINGLRHKDIYKTNTILSSPIKSEPYFRDNYLGRDFTLENMIYFYGNEGTIPAYMTRDHVVKLELSDRKNPTITEFCTSSFKRDLIIGYFTIHNPVEVPSVYEHEFTLKAGETKEIIVIPDLVITERGLDSYKPIERGCFYSHERELSMFKHYCEWNCKMECVANCSLQKCGCVPYYLPRHNTSVNVCLSNCIGASACDCGCLPDCYSLSYKFESLEGFQKQSEQGFLYMYIKQMGFYATLRVSINNLAQFIAYCLGMVGLFNGFSVMVIFEIFYFLTFKLWVFVKNHL